MKNLSGALRERKPREGCDGRAVRDFAIANSSVRRALTRRRELKGEATRANITACQNSSSDVRKIDQRRWELASSSNVRGVLKERPEPSAMTAIELLIHNPVLLPDDLVCFAALVKERGLSE